MLEGRRVAAWDRFDGRASAARMAAWSRSTRIGRAFWCLLGEEGVVGPPGGMVDQGVRREWESPAGWIPILAKRYAMTEDVEKTAH